MAYHVIVTFLFFVTHSFTLPSRIAWQKSGKRLEIWWERSGLEAWSLLGADQNLREGWQLPMKKRVLQSKTGWKNNRTQLKGEKKFHAPENSPTPTPNPRAQSVSLSAVRNGFTQENSRLRMVFNLAGLTLKKPERFLVSFITNRGLLALSAGSFDEAHRHFVAATKLDPYNSVVRPKTLFSSFCVSLS